MGKLVGGAAQRRGQAAVRRLVTLLALVAVPATAGPRAAPVAGDAAGDAASATPGPDPIAAAEALWHDGQWAEAGAAFEQAAGAGQGGAAAILGAARHRRARFDPEGARQILARAVDDGWRDPRIRRELGLLLETREPERAAALLRVSGRRAPAAPAGDEASRADTAEAARRAIEWRFGERFESRLDLPAAAVELALAAVDVAWLVEATGGTGPVRLALDSGATAIFLSPAGARALGARAIATAAARGLGGATASRLLDLPELRLGDPGGLAWRHVTAYSMTGHLPPGAAGLLPLSLLAPLTVRLDAGRGRLRLEPPGETGPAGAVSARLWSLNGRLAVRARIGDRDITCLVDTAASTTLIDDGLASRLGLVPAAAARTVAGVAGDTPARELRLTDIPTIAGVPIGSARALAADLGPLATLCGSRIDAVAGVGLLASGPVAFDLARGRLELGPPAPAAPALSPRS